MKKLTVAALAVTTLLSGSAFAHEAGEFFMRAGSATVRPTEGAGGTLGSLGGFSVTNNTQLGLTFTYMATDNIGVELLAATPFRHKIGTRATGDIATVHHLPPTLMAQWYFGDASSKFRPYVGAGIKEGANKQVISSQADSLIKISRIWADFFPANTSNQPI